MLGLAASDDWAVVQRRLETLRDHCGELCHNNKSIIKERFQD